MDLVLESNNLLSAGRKLKSTPLPKMHDFFVVLMQLAESISVTVMFPFINQFVISTGITGGDEKKSGYYAGMLVSMFPPGYKVCFSYYTMSGIGVLSLTKYDRRAVGQSFR